MEVIRGEIWWVDLPETNSSIPAFSRPVIIIQENAFNKSKINTVLCAVITSNINLVNAPGNIFLHRKQSGLKKDSVINVSQIITIDKAFLRDKCGKVSDKILQEINKGLKLILGL